jgi:ribosomal protein L22
MQIKSIYRGARISAFKAREVTREIQGLPVAAALDIVAFSPKKAAAMVAKTPEERDCKRGEQQQSACRQAGRPRGHGR